MGKTLRFLVSTLFFLGLGVSRIAPAAADEGFMASGPVAAIESPALDSLPQAEAVTGPVLMRRRAPDAVQRPEVADPQGRRGQAALAANHMALRSARRTPTALLNFAGQGNHCNCSPPDTTGDVGPNHYVQAVNATSIAVYNKSGKMLKGYPKQLKSLWKNLPGKCDNSTEGDPTVLYDPLANRWLLTQFFENGKSGVCIAVSQTGDPTGIYWLYAFSTPEFPDYFKLGVWPNAYFMSTNETTYTAYALDRSRMLQGKSAIYIRKTGETNFLLPADIDGKASPGNSAPGLFYTFKDDVTHGGIDSLMVKPFDPNFHNPTLSTFGPATNIPITPFTYTVCGVFNFDCIPQKDTAQKIDAVSEWPMQRFAYRKFSDHESLVGNFTVESATTDAAAIRWFELRNTGSGWTLFQEGTVDSNDGVSRFMGSIAQDQAGNIGLGYSISSAAMFPAIGYSVHRVSDAAGTMDAEQVLQAGGGSQTGSDRWGDYSAMSVDPADDFTFWYTQEYYAASAAQDWRTRIGTFNLLDVVTAESSGANDGQVTESTENSGVGGAISASSLTFQVGDTKARKQMRGVLDFDTAAIPDTATLSGATVYVKLSGVAGKPFASLGKLKADIIDGNFGAAVTLEPVDFQATAGTTAGATLAKAGNWYRGRLSAAALAHLSKTGHTQIRLRFAKDDDNDSASDFAKFASGDAASGRPYLVVKYFDP